MKKWADNCPENFLHKYLLITAEMARISDKEQQAMDFYDRAILSARENEYIQIEAIAKQAAHSKKYALWLFWLGKLQPDFCKEMGMSLSPACRERTAWCTATRELEQAVSIASLGPLKLRK